MGETMPTKQSAAEMAAKVLALRARVSSLEDATRYGEKVCAELVSECDAARAKLYERDREIERLEAELDARSRDVAHMIGERDASQAREREAVVRAEKAESEAIKAQRYMQDDHDRIMSLESALAATRKALEKIANYSHRSVMELKSIARAALKGDGHD